jgi:hypothetical protein
LPSLNSNYWDDSLLSKNPRNCTRDLPPITNLVNGQVVLNDSYSNGVTCEFR